jgi:tight adherence protein B
MNVLTLSMSILVFAGIFALLYALLSGLGRGGDDVGKRLAQYGPGTASVSVEPVVRKPTSPRDMLAVITGAFAPALDRSNRGSKLTDELQKADLRLKVSEWIMAVLASGVLLGIILAIRFSFTLLLFVGVAAAWFGSGFVLHFMQSRRTRKFESQLGETIILLSNALRAGYSFAQAMATVAKSASAPISDEFTRATREIALGVSVDDALRHMVERNASEDFDFLVTAVQIHRVVGGNLSEILDKISSTIRERVRITGEIRTLTAQARASGYIISLLPIALAVFLAFVEKSYFNPMFSSALGIIMLVIAGFMIAVGYAIMQKIVKIEV